MRKLLNLAALLCLAAAPVLGQEIQVESDAQKSETPSFVRLGDLGGEAARLLKSQATRERAWGAYLVGHHGLKALAPALVELMADPSLGDGWEERIVRQAALDSLIRLEVKVPVDALRSIPPDFADEKIVLMSRAADEHVAVLLETFDGELAGESGTDTRWLAVGNLLAETKAQGFAASLLKGLKLVADITILDEDDSYGRGYGGGCGGGCGSGGWPEDFPPVGFYSLTAHASRGAVVVAPGKHPVYYIRAERYEAGCGFSYAPHIRDFYRVEYLAALLDTTADNLKLDARPSHTIICKDTRQCRGELARVRREIEQSYATLIGGLVEKSILDASEAAGMPPDITFRLHDARQKKSFALPDKLKGVKIAIEGTEIEAAPDDAEQ
ncbi:MAG TPA: hypothetical protein VEX60_15545 [Pyrinomonadaceae bacterium]|nr:hypothetical protein [Pyrinomonadaceae bacterium]